MAIKYYSETFRRKKEREAWLIKQKQRREIPHNYSVAKAVLDILLDSLEQVAMIEDPYAKMRKRWVGIPASKRPERWRYNRAVKYLEQIGKVKVIRKDDQEFIELTKKGHIQGLLDRVSKGVFISSTWDHKWRLVIWDIPETSNSERNKIRYFLKRQGFHRLQQSVYIRPYPLSKDAINYLKESGLIKFIRFLRVDKIDDEEEIKARFKLAFQSSKN